MRMYLVRIVCALLVAVTLVVMLRDVAVPGVSQTKDTVLLFKREIPTQKRTLTNEEGNAWIKHRFTQGDPFVVGRLSKGSELCLLAAYRNGVQLTSKSCAHHRPHLSAGIYPETPEMFRTYAEILASSLRDLTQTDAMATFGQPDEGPIFEEMPTVVAMNRALEPFYFDAPWSAHLANKTVLIIHGFIPSIQCQLRRREKLFSNPAVLPAFKTKFVKMPFAHGFRRPHGSYVETLEAVKAMVDAAAPFDVALVSAGAYAMPLAAYCKTAHRATAFAMGGGAQLLFGLKGNRWDKHPVLRRLYNAHWMYPLEQDTPDNADIIDGDGPYWGPRGARLSTCPV